MAATYLDAIVARHREVAAADRRSLDALVAQFEEIGIARVTVTTGHSLISLIGNVERNNEIMERGFRALSDADVKVRMISQGASKTNISLLVDGDQGTEEGKACHVVLHEHFLRGSPTRQRS